jgi:hypothetical protein
MSSPSKAAKIVKSVAHKDGASVAREIPVSSGWVLVKRGPDKRVTVRPGDQATVLVPKMARALSKPGIERSSVFGAAGQAVYAYSVYGSDPTKFVQEAADGTQKIGTLVNGKFRALATG